MPQLLTPTAPKKKPPIDTLSVFAEPPAQAASSAPQATATPQSAAPPTQTATPQAPQQTAATPTARTTTPTARPYTPPQLSSLVSSSSSTFGNSGDARNEATPGGYRYANPRAILNTALGGSGGWREMQQGLRSLGVSDAVLGDTNNRFVSDVRNGHTKAYGDGMWMNNSNGQVTIYDNTGRVVEQRAFDPQRDNAGLSAGAGRQDALYRSLEGAVGWTPGAGSAGHPGGPGGAGGGPGGQANIESDLEAQVRALMSGDLSPFSDEMQGKLRGDSAKRHAAELLNANQNATLAAARGGTNQSPAQASILAENQRAARSGASQDAREIGFEAAKENYGARIEGINQAQALTQRKYQDKWNAATDATQRYQIQQQYELEMKKMEQEKELAQQQISAAGAAAGRSRNWQLEDQAAQWKREDELYQRDLPIELLRLQLGTL